MAHKIVTKAEALKQELPRYYTGKPCPKGHAAERLTNSDKCVECVKERNSRRGRKGKKANDGNTKGKVGTITLIKPPSSPEPVVVPVVAVTPISSDDWQYYADRITAAWQKAVESIIETGRLLIEANSKVQHGDWLKLVDELPFGERTTQRLMEIARNPVLSNPTHVSDLPPSWGTLHALAQLPEPVLLARIEDRTINPDMQRKDVKALAAPKAKPKATERRGLRAKELDVENQDLRDHIDDLQARLKVEEVDNPKLRLLDDDETAADKLIGWYGNERAERIALTVLRRLAPAAPSVEHHKENGVERT